MTVFNRNQHKQLKDAVIALINQSSLALLRTVSAEQNQILDLFLSNPEWSAWRIQKADEVIRAIDKIAEPTKRKKVKSE